MARWKNLLGVCLALAASVAAFEVKLDQKAVNSQRCSGMYNRKDWGGPVGPYVDIKFLIPPGDDVSTSISMVYFEWEDRNLIGKEVSDGNGGTQMKYICDEDAVKDKLCNGTQAGEFLLKDHARENWKVKIMTRPVNPKAPTMAPMKFAVTHTGYYCVGTYAKEGDYTAIVEFRGAYGELAAGQIPKLLFFGATTIAYALLAVYWGFLYYQHRSEILQVQKYISGIIAFLIVEMLMTWIFYDYTNRHGINAGSRVLLMVVSILNAGRNSFSFFLLLIVCMGYGVVKPTLGSRMRKVQALTVVHFLSGVVFTVASLTIHPEDVGPWVLLLILPLSLSLAAFYVWILHSLGHTLMVLNSRSQHVKELMYKRLWWCILINIIVIFLYFTWNAVSIAGPGDTEEFAPTHWKTRWFAMDGWLNVVYFLDLCFIAYIWRPNANNRRFAMSDELPQVDDEFGDAIELRESSIDSFGVPGGENFGARYDTVRERDTDSPLPAPQAQRPSSLSHLTGSPDSHEERPRFNPGKTDTLFAVDTKGESGDDSSEEESDGDYDVVTQPVAGTSSSSLRPAGGRKTVTMPAVPKGRVPSPDDSSDNQHRGHGTDSDRSDDDDAESDEEARLTKARPQAQERMSSLKIFESGKTRAEDSDDDDGHDESARLTRQ